VREVHLQARENEDALRHLLRWLVLLEGGGNELRPLRRQGLAQTLNRCGGRRLQIGLADSRDELVDDRQHRGIGFEHRARNGWHSMRKRLRHAIRGRQRHRRQRRRDVMLSSRQRRQEYEIRPELMTLREGGEALRPRHEQRRRIWQHGEGWLRLLADVGHVADDAASCCHVRLEDRFVSGSSVQPDHRIAKRVRFARCRFRPAVRPAGGVRSTIPRA
jgi:hypothetical protein